MKNNPFQDGFISAQDFGAIEALAEASALPFHKQVRAAGLNPAADLMHSDMSGIVVTNADLSGFNFTGANLMDVVGFDVKWDASTVFDGADLEGSVFALPVQQSFIFENDPEAGRILERMKNSGFNEIVLWAADSLRTRPQSETIKAVVQQIFLDSEDHSLKSQLLFFLSPRMADQQIKELLLASLSSQFLSGPAVRTALGVIKRRGMLKDNAIRRILVALLNSPNASVREDSLILLIRDGVQKSEAREVLTSMKNHPHLGNLYVQRVVASLGEQYKLVVRHPVTRDTFTLGQRIEDLTLYLIARRWLKLEANTLDGRRGIPLGERRPAAEVFEEPAIRERMKLVIALLDDLTNRGIRYEYAAKAFEAEIPNLPREQKIEGRGTIRFHVSGHGSVVASAAVSASPSVHVTT